MTVVDLYTIQIVNDRPPDVPGFVIPDGPTIRRLLVEMEENLTDLLPTGWHARIRRWDHSDPEETPPPCPDSSLLAWGQHLTEGNPDE